MSTPTAYFNEVNGYAANWIGRLVAAGHVADGVVDARSIKEVQPADLTGATQCHFFAGIGVWSYALRLAGVPDSEPIWTGSCPCQPFSAAGKRGGFADDRHLWPEWFRLIRQCRPPVVFGEQVASPDGLRWFDAVSADLEGEGYAVGAADLCAAWVLAPQLRQRLYWVAYSDGNGRPRLSQPNIHEAGRLETPRRIDADGRSGSPWSAARALEGADGTWRALEPGIEPLVDGHPCRVDQLRAIGNAIVPQVAARFIRAAMSVTA